MPAVWRSSSRSFPVIWTTFVHLLLFVHSICPVYWYFKVFTLSSVLHLSYRSYVISLRSASPSITSLGSFELMFCLIIDSHIYTGMSINILSGGPELVATRANVRGKWNDAEPAYLGNIAGLSLIRFSLLQYYEPGSVRYPGQKRM